MFDDIKKEPEDIFSETDKEAPQPIAGSAPAVPIVAGAPTSAQNETAPTQSDSAQSTQESSEFVPTPTPPSNVPQSVSERIETLQEEPSGFSWKAGVIVVAILIVIGLAFWISMRILNSRTPTTPEPPVELSTPPPPTIERSVAPAPIIEPERAPVVEALDTDKDGLTDENESKFGTDPSKADTDGDGLFDREEIEVYETDPLNQDTDSDGYSDGGEVKNGYNPNGQGKLLEIP